MLYTVTKTRETEEPPSDKLSLAIWKDALRKEHWFSDENQLKFYLKTARLSKRCFEKVLELDDGMKGGTITIGSTKRCSQTVMRDILYNQTEVEQYRILCAMIQGEITLADLKKNKGKDKSTNNSSEEHKKELFDEISDLKFWKTDLQLRLEDMTRLNQELESRNKDLEEKFGSLENELEMTKSLLKSVEEERDYWQKQFVEATVFTQSKIIRAGKKAKLSGDTTLSVVEGGKNIHVRKGDGQQPNQGDIQSPDNGDAGPPDHGDVGPPDQGDVQPPDHGDVGPPDHGDLGPPDQGDVGPPDQGDVQQPDQGDVRTPDRGYDDCSESMKSHIDYVPSSEDEGEDVPGTPEFVGIENFSLGLDSLRKDWEGKSREDKVKLKQSKDQGSAVCIKHSKRSESEIDTTTGFVAVAYTAAKPRPAAFHLGKIVRQLSNDDSRISISFLDKLKVGQGYRWPKKENIEMVLKHQVFANDLKATVDPAKTLFFDVDDQLLTDFRKCVNDLTRLERNSKVEAMWECTEAPYRKIGLVTWKDLKTLQLDMPSVHQSLMTTELLSKTSWEVGYLNDEIMDEYIKLLEKMANKKGRNILTANTKFYQLVTKRKPWRKRLVLAKYNKLIFPSQFDSTNHWSLGIIDIKNFNLTIVDPLGPRKNSQHYENLRDFLRDRGFEADWKIRDIEHPIQHDSVSCGVYVLKIAESIMIQPDAPIVFSSYGNSIGKACSVGGKSPTYIYPESLKKVVRVVAREEVEDVQQTHPDPNPQRKTVYKVTIDDLYKAVWPALPKKK
ncbi:Ubiquitin-like-specific protease 1 [Exaiptasia diaphana]|nr:Ubiquitin-like-specific protease 1 [Exaiptasia diaphana]